VVWCVDHFYAIGVTAINQAFLAGDDLDLHSASEDDDEALNDENEYENEGDDEKEEDEEEDEDADDDHAISKTFAHITSTKTQAHPQEDSATGKFAVKLIG